MHEQQDLPPQLTRLQHFIQPTHHLLRHTLDYAPPGKAILKSSCSMSALDSTERKIMSRGTSPLVLMLVMVFLLSTALWKKDAAESILKEQKWSERDRYILLLTFVSLGMTSHCHPLTIFHAALDLKRHLEIFATKTRPLLSSSFVGALLFSYLNTYI